MVFQLKKNRSTRWFNQSDLFMPYLGVFKNRGGPPKSSILIGFSIMNHPFWGTTIFGNTHLEVTFSPSKRDHVFTHPPKKGHKNSQNCCARNTRTTSTLPSRPQICFPLWPSWEWTKNHRKLTCFTPKKLPRWQGTGEDLPNHNETAVRLDFLVLMIHHPYMSKKKGITMYNPPMIQTNPFFHVCSGNGNLPNCFFGGVQEDPRVVDFVVNTPSLLQGGLHPTRLAPRCVTGGWSIGRTKTWIRF